MSTFGPLSALGMALHDVARTNSKAAAGRPGVGNAADPWAAGSANVLSPYRKPVQLRYGVVIDFVSSLHAYRVSTGDGGVVWCSPGGSGFGAYGPRPVTTYPPGTRVQFSRHTESPWVGTIHAAEPPEVYSRENHPADHFWPVYRTGVAADQAHREPIEAAGRAATAAGLPGGIDIWDMSAGRHLDATSAGEVGHIAETGVGVYADPWHAAVRADEATGLWAFYPNQLLRLAGYNFQQRTAVEEAEQADDAGELYAVKRSCTYPWEAYGLWVWNQVTGRRAGSGGQGSVAYGYADVQNGSGLAARDAEAADTLPAARGYEFGGYLGQVKRTQTAAPIQFVYNHPAALTWKRTGAAAFPSGVTPDGTVVDPDIAYFVDKSGAPLAAGDGTPLDTSDAWVPPNTLRKPTGFQPGLLTENRALTGAYHLASAKRIVLAKRASQPTPRQRRRPDDPDGDDGTADADGFAGPYAPSGKQAPPRNAGEAKDWAAHMVVDQLPDVWKGGRGPAAIADILTYAFNWEGLHPFAYHSADWEVPEEGLAGSPLVNQAIPAYARLACAQHLADPPPVFLDVDHRYQSGSYYQTESVVALLDDGSIYVQNGFGATVCLNNADVEVDAPGDINLRAGRNINLWAGHDVVVRGRDSIDLTTTKHDIRLLAARNLQEVAGTSGCGGILLESQALCPGYGFKGKTGEEVNTSGIVMIAPHSQIYGLSQDAVFHSLAGRIILDAGPAGTVRSVAGFHHQVVYTTAVQFFVSGGGVSSANEYRDGSTLFGGDVGVNGGVSAVGPIGGASGAVGYQEAYLTGTYGPGVLAAVENPPDAALAEFSLRTDEEYLTYDWSMWRPRWMTLAAESKQTLPAWTEPVFTSSAQGYTQYPYPGSAWTDPTAFKWSDPYLADPDRGWVGVPRRPAPGQVGPQYENPAPPPVSADEPQLQYLVIVPPIDNHRNCGSNLVPPPPPNSFEAILQGGWGWPRQGKEGNINDLVQSGFWPAPPPAPTSPATAGGNPPAPGAPGGPPAEQQPLTGRRQ